MIDTQYRKPLNIKKSTLVFIFIFIFCVLFKIFVSSQHLSDYQTYLEYASNIESGNISLKNWEFLTTFVFSLINYYTNDTNYSVLVIYFYLLAFYLVSLSLLIRIYNINYLNLFIFFCLYGPLLAFITIRATPAYFLVFLSIYLISDNRFILSFFVVLMASFFHVSALLVLPSLLAAWILSKYKNFRNHYLNIIACLTIFIILLGFILDENTFPSLLNFLITIGIPDKYGVYFENIESKRSFFHGCYYIFASLIILYLLRHKKTFNTSLLVCILTSSWSYFLLSYSPALAFRQSIYWIAPAVFILPLEKILNNNLFKLCFLVSSLILLCVSIFSVLNPNYYANIFN